MRGILRAAAYVPAASVHGRHTAGPDEDGFTLGATALERLWDGGRSPPPAARLEFVGDLPAEADDDFVRFLGYPVLTERFGTGAPGLRAAVQDAADPSRGSGPILLAVVDLPSRVEGRSPHPSEPDRAVALWVSEDGRADLLESLRGLAGQGESATAPIFRLARERRVQEPDPWVGDWDLGPGRELPAGALPLLGSKLPAGGPVSQGAYVPRPRYLENLPSRWSFAGERCPACSTVTFPARGRCRQCGLREGLESARLPRDGGEVIASTVIGPGGQPTEFDDQVAALGPYGVVLVELAPGARVTLQVADAEQGAIRVGQRVDTRLRRLYPMEGEWRYGRKAVPRD